MDRARRFSTVLIALIMVSTGLLFIFNDLVGTAAPEIDKEMGTRAIPWNQVVPGTEIKIAPKKFVNGSYYYPIPIGSTVLSANISYSNIPYTEGGSDYSMNAWINIGGTPKEFIYGATGEQMYGQWGKQTQTRLGEKSFDFLLDGVNRAGGKFVLPKNASLTSAKFNITGFQRTSEYEDWYHAGTMNGDKLGYIVRDMGNRYLAMGAPGVSTSSGYFYIITGSMTTITIYTLAIGSTIRSELGSSISEPFTVTGIAQQQVAVGAPGYSADRGYVEVMGLSTGYRSFQKIEGNNTRDRFGEAIGAGDIDGDGDDELIIGAPNAESGRGTVFIYHQVVNESANNATEFALLTVMNGSASDTDFGKSIAIGDINGDNIDDIVVASNEDVYVYHGGSTIDVTHDTNFDPLSVYTFNTIQNVKFLGQLTISGADSLGIALPHLTSGTALIHHGGSSYDTTADVTFSSPTGTNTRNYGWDIDVGYDINNDGTAEVAIGAPGDVTTRGWTGIYSINTVSSPIDSFTSPANNDNYGSSVAFGTDLRGDGYGDLVMGAPTTMVGTNKVGMIRIQERLPQSQIPENKPVVYIGGSEEWSYDGDHLPEGTTITTGDLSDAINSYLASSNVDFSTPHDGYVYIDIDMDMATFSRNEHSNHFNMSNFELIFDYQRSTGEIASAFNDFLGSPPPDAVDLIENIVKVPIKYGGTSEGGVRIDTIEMELDLVPEIEGEFGLLHINEDTHEMNLFDAYLVFEDDYTPDDELTYSVFKTGQNSPKFNAYMVDERYVAIDLPNGTDSANWSGDIQIYLVALDVNGGRAQTNDISIRVDPVNDAPAVTRLPDDMIHQSAKFQYIPHARDAEGDDINFTLKEGHYPENMTVDFLGTVIFEPTGWQIGIQEWVLVLSDGEEQREYTFSLEVANVNDRPIFITETPVGEEVLVGDTLAIQFRAYDLDPADMVRFSLPEGPAGSSIGFETGFLTWTPLIYMNEPQKFKVRATDLDGAHADIIFFVNVTFLDEEPEIRSSPETSLSDLVEWTYHIVVIDLDDDIVFIELNEGPEGMIFDSEISDSLIWTPSSDQIGSFDVSIRIASTGYELFQNFTVTVSRSPRVWDITLDKSKDGTKVTGKINIGGEVSVSPSTVSGVYVEIDGEQTVLVPVQGEGWTYTIDTNDYDDGDLVIKITATDGVVNSTSDTITLIVANDEGKMSPIVIILIVVLVIIVLAIAVIGVLVLMRMQKKKDEEEEERRKAEELQRSKDEVDQFLQTSDKVEGDTSAFDQVHEEEVDQSRLDAIDDVFAPMKQEDVPDDIQMLGGEIPEDLLQKAVVQESIIQQEPPVEQNVPPLEEHIVPHPEEPPMEQ